MEIICKHTTSHNMNREYFQIHTHACFEIFYMFRGTGAFMVEGHEYPILQNSLILLRPGEMHRAEIEPDCIYERCFLHFSEETALQLDPSGRLLRPFLDRELGQSNYFDSESMDADLIKTLLLKTEQLLHQATEDKGFASHYLFVILKEVEASFQKRAAFQHNYDKQIYEIIQFIDKNICSKLSVSDIEKRFFISRPALYKRFKHATGTTVWNYIVTKRIVLAQQMIENGESVTQAAYTCGYSDYSSFYRAYCRLFGNPPRSHSGETDAHDPFIPKS